MSNDPIADKLGLSPLVYSPVIEYTPIELDNNADAEQKLKDDTAYARTNFYQTIETGNRALELIVDLANQSQSPRAFEVLATLMKTITDANKELVDMSRKAVEINKPEQKVQHTTNQMIFNGSTKDLLEFIKKNKE